MEGCTPCRTHPFGWAGEAGASLTFSLGLPLAPPASHPFNPLLALRAAFRAALAGKQVGVLAPTTVLVQQHYHTFRERMEGFGVRVEHLNRFVSAADGKRIVEGNVPEVLICHVLPPLLNSSVDFSSTFSSN